MDDEKFEKSFKELEEKYGKGTIMNFADVMLDMLCSIDIKSAKILKKKQNIENIAQEIITEIILKNPKKFEDNQNEKMDKLFSFFDNIENQFKNFMKEIIQDVSKEEQKK